VAPAASIHVTAAVLSVSFDRALEQLRTSTVEQQVSAALVQLSQLLHYNGRGTAWPSDARALLIHAAASVRQEYPATWTGGVAAAFGSLLRSLGAPAEAADAAAV
jgi:hypothetical protein